MGSANRDENAFDEPDSFLPHHVPAPPTLAFGLGPHACLGARLAGQAATLGLHAVLSRAPSLRTVKDSANVPLVDSPHLRGPTRLLVRSAG